MSPTKWCSWTPERSSRVASRLSYSGHPKANVFSNSSTPGANARMIGLAPSRGEERPAPLASRSERALLADIGNNKPQKSGAADFQLVNGDGILLIEGGLHLKGMRLLHGV